jgi:hypothetical protein
MFLRQSEKFLRGCLHKSVFSTGGSRWATLYETGMTTEVRYLSTPGIRSDRGPWKLGPSIIIVKIRDCIVTRIVICIKLDRFLETSPSIKGAKKGRPGTHIEIKPRLILSLLSIHNTRLVCLKPYL